MRVFKKIISIIISAAFILSLIPHDSEACYFRRPWHYGSQGTTTEAVDQKGKNPQNSDEKNQKAEGEPVYLHNGDFVYDKEDLLLPSRGMPVEITRRYNSQSLHNGQYGYGWDFNYNQRIIPLTNGDLMYLDGQNKRYRFKYANGTDFASPSQIYDNVKQNDNGTYTLTKKDNRKFNFDQNGCLAEIIDRSGNKISFTYDAQDRLLLIGISPFSDDPNPKVIAYDYQLTKITDTVGREITLAYDATGHLWTITDFAGRVIIYNYDALGDLRSITSPATTDFPSGTTIYYTYVNHNLKTITDAKSQMYLENFYDSQDRVESQRYGGGLVFFTYDTQNKKTEYKDAKGARMIYTFNDSGNVLKKEELGIGSGAGDPQDYVTTYEYNNHLESTKVIYPKGNSIIYDYDAIGNLLEVRRKAPAGQTEPDIVTTLTYESRYNFVKTLKDPKDNVTTYYYDYEEAALGDLNGDGVTSQDKGNLVKITYPVVNSQVPEAKFTYNSYGQPLTVTDPNSNVTKYEYYPDTGYLKKLTRGFTSLYESTAEFTYDTAGNVATIKDPRGNLTTFEHDSHNNLTKTIASSPFSYITNYKYDANDLLSQVDKQTDDPSNPWQTTYYTYDILDRLKTITDDAGYITTYGYDLNGNRNLITDAELNATDYVYNERDLLWKVIQHDEGMNIVTEYTYDANANPKEIKDAGSNLTTYSYDGFDRLEKTMYDDSSQEIYTYDKNSNLRTKTNRKNQMITYDYDELNRLYLKDLPDLPDVQYIYDVGSRLKDAISDGKTLHYDYDNLNRVKTVTFPDSKTVGYEYDAAGNRKKLTYPDSSYITYDYDELNRLEYIRDAQSQAIAHYTYDALSRRKQADLANNTKAVYQYDSINRLISLANQAIAGQNISTFAYPSYDKVGNRLASSSLRGGAAGADEAIYTYDDIYQLKHVNYSDGFPNPDTTYNYDKLGNRSSTVNGGTTTYVPNDLNQYSSVGGVIHTYDNNGNLTSTGTNTYGYDYENRLIHAVIASPQGEAVYSYDAFGRRISKTVNGVTTTFLYDGDDIIAEYDASGNLVTKYVYGDSIDEPIRMDKGGQSYYYHSDGLGSVTNLTDATGASVESYSYDVFGKPSATSAVGNRYMFTGREYDSETGLYHYRERSYSPQIGRFLQRDPLQIDDENTYSYCYNDPVNWIDPYGLMSILPSSPGIGVGPLPQPLPGGGILPPIPQPGGNAPTNGKTCLTGSKDSDSSVSKKGVIEKIKDWLKGKKKPPEKKGDKKGKREQIFDKHSSQEKAREEAKKKGLWRDEPERHRLKDGTMGDWHYHDKNHDDPTQPNIHYGF